MGYLDTPDMAVAWSMDMKTLLDFVIVGAVILAAVAYIPVALPVFFAWLFDQNRSSSKRS
jgi:hypothetical protein